VSGGLPENFNAAIDVLTVPKNGDYALLNSGPHPYENGKAILTIYLSTTYRGARCKIIPTEHN
jgi:hypothetical protein